MKRVRQSRRQQRRFSSSEKAICIFVILLCCYSSSLHCKNFPVLCPLRVVTAYNVVGQKMLRKLITSSIPQTESNMDDDGKKIDAAASSLLPPFAKRGIHLDDIDSKTLRKRLQDLVTIGPDALIGRDPATSDDRHDGDGISCEDCCEMLAKEGYPSYSIKCPKFEDLMNFTFLSVIDSMALHGYKTKLSSYDLFHGHMFTTETRLGGCEQEDGSIDDSFGATKLIGILFHCYEYPGVIDANITVASDGVVEEAAEILNGIDLGHYRYESDCFPTLEEWQYRNVLWAAHWNDNMEDASHRRSTAPAPVVVSDIRQDIWLLDGKDEDIVAHLRIDGTPFGPGCPNTVWEGYLGKPICDVYNLDGTICCAYLASTWP